MKKISFGGKKFRFIDSFGQFTCTTIKEYMSIHDDTDELIKQYNDRLTQVKDYVTGLESDQEDIASLINMDSELTDIQFRLTGKRIDLLCLLCPNPKFRKFVVNTDGMSYSLIKTALSYCLDNLGSFTDYWDACPAISYFKIKTSKFRNKKFKVHHFDKTTLYRETLASLQSQKALNHKTKLDSGSWDDICEFVAIIVRPSNQVEEISFTKPAFIQGNKIKQMSHSEKLKYYEEKFDVVWKERTKLFKDLPLDIAVGVLKDFFQKKKT